MKALVLSGGGVKGSYQAGVLKRWMGEQGVEYDIICGVSVGALNTAALALTPKGQPDVAAKTLEQIWKTQITTSVVYKRWFPFGWLHSLWLNSVYDSSPLQKLVEKTVDIKKIASNGRMLAVGSVCLDTGEYTYARESDPNFAQWVLASSSYPVFLEPIRINGMLYSDGGIKHVTPLGQAIKMGASEVDIIMCSNLKDGPFDSNSTQAVPGIMLRSIDLMNDQIISDDLQICGLKNDLVAIKPQYRNIKVRLVKPSGVLTTNSLDFNHNDIVRIFEQGYKDADNVVEYF